MTPKYAVLQVPAPRLQFPRVLLGGLAVGTFDLLFACTWWAIAASVPPMRIFQGIASGLYGESSFEGGVRTATVGIVAHYFIAACMVFAYALVASRSPSLMRHPWRWGSAYGLLLYAAMNFVVVPLSAAGPSPVRMTAWTMASIVVHVIIGIACAFIARSAVRSR